MGEARPSASDKSHPRLPLTRGPQVTGLLSMLRHMAAQYAEGAAAGLPRRVHCVWVARCAGEFGALDAPLLLAAT